ncbi:MAG: 2-C-methyl-D-erythritol 2,4-cyclodiphosphate synthase [Kiritimatiellae bacterium]|nr:2-C-methyl-D-erythritol 2,4-cyclodiphosphate synthase [Kiritimatiellia bacterium]
MRVGFGYDSHVFEAGKPLVLGGVTIPGSDGLKAHSDGDAVIHALIDALLGAAALGDIGSHFPDTDERYRGADSSKLLEKVAGEVRAAGYAICNIDITVICERPRLREHVNGIRCNLARLTGLDAGCVSIKGKTNEKMDDVGAGKGIEVHAAILLS